MADNADLKFIVKMEDQFSSALNAFGSQLKGVSATLQAQLGVMNQLSGALSAQADGHDKVAAAAKRAADAHREAASAAASSAEAHADHAESSGDAADATREHASALREEGAAAKEAAEGHKEAKEAAEEHEEGLRGLVSVTKEAAEAFAAMWAMTEVREKTIGAYAEMEVPLLRIKQTAGASAEQLKEFQETIEKFSTASLNQTNEQLAEVLHSALELGTGAEHVEAFVKTISELATVTGMTTGEVTQGFSAILAATGEAADGAEKLGDAFAELSKRTRGGAEGLLQNANMLAQMTAGMGLSSTQVVGLAASLTNLGIRSRMATGSVGEVFRTFQHLADDRTLVTQLNQVAGALDMTAGEFKEMEKADPEKLFERLAEGLKSWEDKGRNGKDFLKAVGLDSDAVEQTMNAINKKFDEFKNTQLAAANAPKGSLDNRAGDFAKTLAQEMHDAQKSVNDLAESLGQAVSPSVSATLHGLGAAAHFVKDQFDALGPVTKQIIGDFIIGIPSIIAAGTAWKLLTEVAKTGIGSFRNLAGPLGEAVKVVRLFTTAGEEASTVEKKVEGATIEATAAIKTHGEAMAVAAGQARAFSVAEREAGAAAVVAATEGAAAAEASATKTVLAYRTQMQAAEAASSVSGRFGRAWDVMKNSSALAVASMIGDIGLYIAAINQIETSVDLESKLTEAGVGTFGEIVALAHSFGAISDETRNSYFKKQQDAGTFKPEKLKLGGNEEKEHKEEAEKREETTNMYGRAGYGKNAGQNTDAAAMRARAAVTKSQLQDLVEYTKKVDDLKNAEDSLAELRSSTAGMSDEQLQSQLGLTRAQIEAEGQLLALRKLELNPLNAARESWGFQLASAMAYNKLQEEAVATEQKVVEARKAALNAHQDPDAAENETRKAEGMINDAARQKGFVDMMRGYAQALQSAAALTSTDKERLEIEKQIEAIQREKGYAADDPRLAQLKQILELTQQVQDRVAQFKQLNPQAEAIRSYNEQVGVLDANRSSMGEDEYKRERTKLDNDTLAQRSPVGKIVQDQQDEIAQLAIVGKYRDADLKTLQEITALQRQGVDLSSAQGQAMASQISKSNRAVQDLKDAQQQLQTLATDFGGDLSSAIGNALNGQKYAFQKAAAQFGQQMMTMGINNLVKQFEPNLNGLLGGFFGNAKSATDALGKTAAAQVASTTNTASMTVASSSAIINATTAYINGVTGAASAQGALAAPFAQSTATTTQAAQAAGASVPGVAGAAAAAAGTGAGGASPSTLSVAPASFGGAPTSVTGATGGAEASAAPAVTGGSGGVGALPGVAGAAAGLGGAGGASTSLTETPLSSIPNATGPLPAAGAINPGDFGKAFPMPSFQGGAAAALPKVSGADTARFTSALDRPPTPGDMAAINKYGVEHAITLSNNPSMKVQDTQWWHGDKDWKSFDPDMTNKEYLQSLAPKGGEPALTHPNPSFDQGMKIGDPSALMKLPEGLMKGGGGGGAGAAANPYGTLDPSAFAKGGATGQFGPGAMTGNGVGAIANPYAMGQLPSAAQVGAMQPQLTAMNPLHSVNAPGTGGDFYHAVMMHESGGRNILNTNVPPGTASAEGYYQFMPKTWQGVRAQNPNLSLPASAHAATFEQQTAAYHALTKNSTDDLANHGIPITDKNTFMESWFGPKAPGFIKGMQQNPSQSAASMLPGEARVNHNDFYDKATGRPYSAQEFYDRETKTFGNGNTTGFGPKNPASPFKDGGSATMGQTASLNEMNSTAMKQLQTQTFDNLKKQMDGLTGTQKTMTAQLADTGKQFQTDFTGMGSSIKGVGSTALGAVPDMSQFGQSISQMVSKIGQSGGGGGGGGFGSLFGGGGGGGFGDMGDFGDFAAFHSGGVVGSTFGSSLSRSVSPSIFVGAPRFHDGLTDDEFPAILQRGERVLTQAQDQRNAATMNRLADAVANQSSQAGTERQTSARQRTPTHVTMNISTPNANSFRYSQSQIMAQAQAGMSRASARHN